MASMSADGPILYFDGVCNLCNDSVLLVIKNDKQKRFRFASLQSEAGNKAVKELAVQNGGAPDSMVLYYNGKYHVKSSAALHAARLMGGAWSLISVFLIVPAFIRNVVYDFIARNRYRWFGKKDECMIPTPELKSRFLS